MMKQWVTSMISKIKEINCGFLFITVICFFVSPSVSAQLKEVWRYKSVKPIYADDYIDDAFKDNQVNGNLYAIGGEKGVIKINTEGTVLFEAAAGGSMSKQDALGNVVFVGWSPTEIVTSKVSPTGTVLWTKTYSKDPNWSRSVDMVIDGNNNIYVLGEVNNTTAGRDRDGVLIKYLPDGTQAWAQLLSAFEVGIGAVNFVDKPDRVLVDSNNNVYTVMSANGSYVLIQKFNPAGTPLWYNQLSGQHFLNYPFQSIAMDVNDKLYVMTMVFRSLVEHNEIMVNKINSQGVLEWGSYLNGNTGDGDLGWVLTPDPSGSSLYVGGTTAIPSANAHALMTFKLNTNGVTAWEASYPTPTHTSISSMVNSFDPGGNLIVRTTNRDNFHIVKYSPAGTQMSGYTLNDGTPFFSIRGSDLDAAGNLYLHGWKDVNGSFGNTVLKKYGADGTFRYEQQFEGNTATLNSIIPSMNAGSRRLTVAGFFQNTATNVDGLLVQYEEVPFVVADGSFTPFATSVGGTALVQQVHIHGDLLLAPVQVKAPSQFKISKTGLAGSYGSTITIDPQSGVLDATLYLVYTPTSSSPQIGSVTISSDGMAPDVLIPITGSTTPSLSANGSLGEFVSQVNASSFVQEVTAASSNLTTVTTITAPTHFQVSLTNVDADFSSQLILPVVVNAPTKQSIYVRYKPSVAGSHSGTITFTSGGVSATPIAVSGTTNAAIGVSSSLLPFTAGKGLQSTPQAIEVSAKNLLSTTFTITAPANFLISKSGVAGSGFSSVSLLVTSGTVTPQTIWLIYAPTTINAAHTGNVTLTCGAVTKLIPVLGNSVPQVNVDVSSLAPFFHKARGAYAPIDVIQYFVINATNVPSTGLILTSGNFNLAINDKYDDGFTGLTKTVIPNSDGVVNKAIYVRYWATTPGLHNGDITLNDGMAVQNIAISADSRPVVNVTSNLTTFSTQPSTISVQQSFSLNGLNIANNPPNDLLLTAPTYFALSKSEDGPFTSSISFNGNTDMNMLGELLEKTIYVQYQPPALANTHSGNIAITSTGLTTVNIPVTGVSDFVAPVITSNPINGSAGFSRNGVITINFNEAVRNLDNSTISNPSSLLGLKLTNTSGAAVPFTANINAAKTQIDIDPTTDLLASQLYYLSLASVEDNSNNATAAYSITFTTAAVPDATAPVISFTPSGAATGVSVSGTIIINSSELIRKVDNSMIVDGNVASLLVLRETNSTGTVVQFSASINSAKTQITITPTLNLKPLQVYYVSLAIVEDAANNAVGAISTTTFTTAVDAQSPQLTFKPTNAATNVGIKDPIIITFSESVRKIDDTPITTTNVLPLIQLRIGNASGTLLPFSAGISSNKSQIYVYPTVNSFGAYYDPLQTYYVSVANLEDASNNAIALESSVFTTEVSKVATLSNIGISAGSLSPAFTSSELNYTVTLPVGTTVIPTITPTKTDPNSTIQTSLASSLTGTPAARTTEITVTAQNNVAQKIYRITYSILPSHEARLSNLSVSQGMWNTPFSSSIDTYIITLPFGTTTVPTVTNSAPMQADATVNVSNAQNVTGTSTQRTTSITVTAQDGSTQKTYRIIYVVATTAVASNVASLSALQVSSGTLTPSFASGTLNYTVTLPSGTTAIPTVTPTKTDNNASAVTAPATSLTGTAASRTANVTVTAEDGTTQKIYSVVFSVAAPLSNVATLSALQVSSGTLTPSFASGTLNYTVTLPSGTTAIPTVTSTKTDNTASAVTAPATSLTGTAASRTANVTVTAEDGTTQKIYSVVFSVAAPLNNVATLSALQVSSGTLTPSFASGTLNYTVTLPSGTATIPTVTPTKTDNNASAVTVPAMSLTGTAASRTANVTVTAEDGATQKIYSVVFSVAAPLSNVATLSALQVSSGTLTPSFASGTLDYTVTLPSGTTVIPTVTPTKTDNNASAVTAPATSLTGTAASRTANVTVTGEDGISKKTYSIVFYVTGSINPIAQYITFNSLSDKTYGEAPFDLAATGGASGNAITYTSSNTDVATVTNKTVTIVGAGTTTITASQSGNANYDMAVDVPQLLTINKADQVITFAALPNRNRKDSPFVLQATGGQSGNAVTYSSSNTSVATITGNTVTILDVGSTTITASQTGNTNFKAALSVPQLLIIDNLVRQEITFAALADVTFGDPSFTLSASASSGLAVTYSTTDDEVLITESLVSIVKPGYVEIKADQAGSNSFSSALQVTQGFCINPARPSISASFADASLPILTSSSETGNQWFLNDIAIAGATNSTYPIAQEGAYTLVVVAENCSSAKSQPYDIIVTGTSKSNLSLSITCYPNPATTSIMVNAEGAATTPVYIYNASGQLMSSKNEYINQPIDISHYPQGFYIIHVPVGKNKMHTTFIK